jgi:hypothetical protein
MADPLVDVAVRVYADFADRPTLADVVAVVARARNHLDTPSAAPLPGLVERRAPATARLQPDTVPTPPVKAVQVLRMRRAWACR